MFKDNCCKQCRHVKFKGIQTLWPVQKQKHQHQQWFFQVIWVPTCYGQWITLGFNPVLTRILIYLCITSKLLLFLFTNDTLKNKIQQYTLAIMKSCLNKSENNGTFFRNHKVHVGKQQRLFYWNFIHTNDAPAH